MPERRPLRDVTHQHLYHHEQLVGSLPKACSGLRWRCSPDGLLKVRVRSGVIQLDSLDATNVVVVTSPLGIHSGCGECGLGYEFIRLVVKGVVEVRAKETVDEGSVGFIIMAKRGRPLRGEEHAREDGVA